MRLMGGLLVLLAQFGPLAGAGLCLHAAAQPKMDCSAPMTGMPKDSGHQHPDPLQNCGQMAICTPVAQVAPLATVHLLVITATGNANFATPTSLSPGDPTAPPQPPPNI